MKTVVLSMSKQITVVGAGVIGLSAALVLAEQGFQVTVVAKNFPTDALTSEYTSPWAGAHFRPFPSKSESESREMKLTRITQKHFKKLTKSEPESSVRFVEGIEYFEAPDDYYKAIAKGYREEMDDFEVLPESELPTGCVLGTKYTTWVINSPHYIRYLQQKLTFKFGVKFIRMNLKSLKQVFEGFSSCSPIVINASGRGLQYNGGYDPKGQLIRGQTLLVRAPQNCPYLHKTITHQSKEGLWTFVIPRPLDGGIILGGTKQFNDYTTTPKEEDTQALISRAKILYPELFIDGQLDIRNINVGFRPARTGGIRLEVEKCPKGNVVHAYGAGGMGYELSYGMGQEVLKLVQNLSVPSRAAKL